MLQFFSDVADLVVVVINFVMSAIQSLINAVIFIGRAFAAIPAILAVLPATIQVPVLAFVSYMVITTVINKGR